MTFGTPRGENLCAAVLRCVLFGESGMTTESGESGDVRSGTLGVDATAAGAAGVAAAAVEMAVASGMAAEAAVAWCGTAALGANGRALDSCECGSLGGIVGGSLPAASVAGVEL